MDPTHNTRVKVPTWTSVPVPSGSGNKIHDVPLLKPTLSKTGRGQSSTDNLNEKRLLFTAKSLTTVGTWNVPTLYATSAGSMLMHELKRMRWEIIGIAETHLTGVQESMIEGYKLISSGKEAEHSSGVGLVLSANAQLAVTGYNPVSDRIISARFQMMVGMATICQVYAPTAVSSEEAINEFYLDLQQELHRIPKIDLLIVMGDFNAKVGMGDEGTRQVMGNFGTGRRNDRARDSLISAVRTIYLSQTHDSSSPRKTESGHGRHPVKEHTIKSIIFW